MSYGVTVVGRREIKTSESSALLAESDHVSTQIFTLWAGIGLLM